MQVFKCFFKIIRQNIGIISMYLVIFITLTVAFSGMGGQADAKTFADSRVNITIIDNDNSEVSEKLSGLLYGKHNRVDIANDTEALQDALYIRETSYVLFIPEGYGESVAAGSPLPLESAQIPNSFYSAYVDRMIDSFIAATGVYLDAGFSVSDSLDNAAADISGEAAVTLTQGQSYDVSPMYYYFKFLGYSIMLIAIFGICPVLMVFNRKNIAMRMDSSALPLRKKNIGLGGGTLVFSVVGYAALILLGFVMYGAEMVSESGRICMLNAACFVLISASLAYLIGQLATNGNVLSAIGNAVGLALCFLGGVFVPVELMSSAMQNIALFTPTYWYVHVAELSIGSGSLSAGVTDGIWQSMGIQLLFALAFMAAALVVSRYKKTAA
jgi:ABC-2 type transport system permease protein